MAWQLVREVTHATGVKLTGAEFKVLVVIAEECRDVNTRTVAIERDVIAARARVSADTVKRALRSLRTKGLDPRVPVPGVKDSAGQPVYAWPGRPCTYRLPHLGPEPAEDDKGGDPAPPKGGHGAPPKGGQPAPPRTGRGAGREPSRAEVGRARAAAVADCAVCDEFGYVTRDGRAINHHPRPGYTKPSRHLDG